MAQRGYPGYGGNQAYQAYNAPAPPRSPALAYDPAHATSPSNPIAPYGAPMLPQFNFASAGPQYGNNGSANAEKPLLDFAGYPAPAKDNQTISYPAPTRKASVATASSDTRYGPSNSLEQQPLTPSLPYVTAPEQATRRSDGTVYGGVAISVDEHAGYTPGGLKVYHLSSSTISLRNH